MAGPAGILRLKLERSSIESPRLLKVISESLGADAPERGIEAALVGVLELTGASNAQVGRLDDESGALVLQYGVGADWNRDRHAPISIPHAQGIVGWVVETGQTVASRDVLAEPKYRELFAGTRSEIASPIFDDEGRVRAVLNVEWNTENPFSRGEVELVEGVAAVIGSLLLRLDQLRREEALIRIGSALDTAMDEDELISAVMQVGEEVLRLHSCSVFLFDVGLGKLVLRGTIGELRPHVGQLTYDLGEGFTGWVAQNAQPILLHSPQSDPRWRGKYVEIPSSQISSFVAVPISFGSTTYGVIRALRRRSERHKIDNRFTVRDQQLLAAIAEQIGTGLENIRNVRHALRNERMIAWGELSAKSSHMIGNRVFAIRGDVNELGHLLGSAELDHAAVNDLYQSLLRNVTRIEEVLNDFRDFVSATQVQKGPVDVNQLVKETAEEVFPKRTDNQLILELGHLPPVQADDRRLRRAISELIENSLNYISAGTLRVSTGTLASGRFVQIVVEDSGPGIPNEKKKLVFQPFFSGRSKGMGLGLSIVRGILEAHGGDAFEDGVPGEGARFVLVLPS